MQSKGSYLPFWRVWHSVPDERSMALPCDDLLPNAQDVLHRAIDVEAPVSYLFTRLCQLRIAPYSYDLLDNLGRKSPAKVLVNPSDLKIGDPIMTIFSLRSFDRDRQITISMSSPKGRSIFGDLAITYWVRPLSLMRSRVLIRMLMTYPARYPAHLIKHILPFGDWFMCQKQLRSFKKYAEADFELHTHKGNLPWAD